MKALTEYIAKSLVDHPEEVVVDEVRHGNRVTLELTSPKTIWGGLSAGVGAWRMPFARFCE